MTKPTIRATLKLGAFDNANTPTTALSGTGSLVAVRKGELCEVITVRTYWNPRGNGMQPVRACVWIKHPADGAWRSGKGAASGCGYHKESQAVADAVSSAGVELWGSAYSYNREPVDMKKRVYFGGTGSSAYPDIFKAIARAMGYRGRMLWIANGI